MHVANHSQQGYGAFANCYQYGSGATMKAPAASLEIAIAPIGIATAGAGAAVADAP
jgi:hypothetical protein